MQSAVSASPDDATRAPDWEIILHDVKCPLCGYNLRGLHEPRCPECGYAFIWQAVLESGRDRHPYLFEHHPERNVRSFLRTFLHPVISPSNFWESINPAQPIRPRRVILYWFIYALLALIPLALGMVAIFQSARAHNPFLRTQSWSHIWIYITAGVHLGGAEACVLVLLLFPWINFLTLMLFQQSMRSAKVRPIHILRCALYSGDVIVWYSIIAAIAVATIEPDLALRRLGNPTLDLLVGGDKLIWILWIAALAVGLVTTFRLFIACRHYLKIERALSLAIASETVVAFAVLAALWVLPQVL